MIDDAIVPTHRLNGLAGHFRASHLLRRAFRQRRDSVSPLTLGRRKAARRRPIRRFRRAHAEDSRSTNDVHAASPIRRARPPSGGGCNRDRPGPRHEVRRGSMSSEHRAELAGADRREPVCRPQRAAAEDRGGHERFPVLLIASRDPCRAQTNQSISSVTGADTSMLSPGACSASMPARNSLLASRARNESPRSADFSTKPGQSGAIICRTTLCVTRANPALSNVAAISARAGSSVSIRGCSTKKCRCGKSLSRVPLRMQT